MIFRALVLRDLLRSARSSTLGLPIIFFLMVATLFPFAVGPDSHLLMRTGGGVIWVAALLAALLPIDRLLAFDFEQGVFDQLAVRHVSEEIVALAKIVAHWLGFGPVLMAAAVPASALLKLDSANLLRVEIGLLLGTPGLAALGVMTAGLTLSLRGASALSGLLMLPLAVPMLIFGAGSLSVAGASGLKLLAASSLLLVAITPFATGAALRAIRR